MKQQKNKQRTKTCYILGEMCGKVAVWCTGLAFISFVAGMICELIWDVSELKEESKR
jgi:hypothetical protein